MKPLALALACALSAAFPATAAVRFALVIGEAGYGSFPALPACAASAGLVGRKLQAAGYTVTVAPDLSNGALGGAIGAFAAQVTGAPGSAALVYMCGYGAALDTRDFVLPVTASAARATDLLSEGVLARAFISIPPASSPAHPAPVNIVLDLVRDPTGALAPITGSLARAALPAGTGLLMVSETRPPSAPTALAGALATLFAGDPLPAAPLTILAHALPTGSNASVAGVQDAAAAPAAPVATPVPPNPAVPPSPTSTTGGSALPDDAMMTPSDRERVQTVLASMGYYAGRLDGLFGPDTRAAIRRWQHEVGAGMTGTLTSAEATRLASHQH